MNDTLGSFTISLDFELYWGVRDKRSVKAYEKNLLGTWEVIPKMLGLFQEYKMHVTWATVGFLFLQNKEDFNKNLPHVLPKYKDQKLNPYVYFSTLKSINLDSNKLAKIHFANLLINLINKYPDQEIATHTYSHYYTREPSISLDAFREDLTKAMLIGKKSSIDITSLVFPRNQIDEESLNIVKEVGLSIFRGNPIHWAYKDGEMKKTFLQRVYRFFDIYLNLSGSHTTAPINTRGLIEVKSSIFFRAYSKKFKFLEKLKVRRIKNAMTHAAQKGKNFHLWWHPHNFGITQDENMKNLKEVLAHYKYLNKKYGMESLNMQELSSFYE